MDGGSIEGNTARHNGGGVTNEGTFTMEGGSIVDNTAMLNGGGVYTYGTFTMNSGGIKDDIYRKNGTISIQGGYLGEDAKDSIQTSWVAGGSLTTNDGSNSAYPKDTYPYMVK
jgi:hypothetical protein